jgi:hypothetical protein
MTLKTRLFGKKVKGDALKSLVSALGENPSKLLETPEEGWKSGEMYGKASFSPAKEGINVDLYVFREDYFLLGDIIPLTSNIYNNDSYGGGVSPNDISNNILINSNKKHLQGEIKYTIKENKIKDGTSTGTGVFI